MGWSRDSWSTCEILEISNQEGSVRVQKTKRRTLRRRPWPCSPSETALLPCCSCSCALVFAEYVYLEIKKTFRPLCTTVVQIPQCTNFKFKISSRCSNIIKHDMNMSTLIAIVSDYVEEGFFLFVCLFVSYQSVSLSILNRRASSQPRPLFPGLIPSFHERS